MLESNVSIDNKCKNIGLRGQNSEKPFISSVHKRRCVEGGVLVAKGVSITEAAHNAGFTDSAHFSRVFKKLFGITLSSALQERMPVLVIGDVDEQILL